MNQIIGKKVKDDLTGFEGTATAYCQYITGCNQVLVTPKGTDSSKHTESFWIDEQRLTVDKMVPKFTVDNGVNPGSMEPAPTK